MRRLAGEINWGSGRFFLAALVAIMLIRPLAAGAGDLVTGRYLPGDGREIKIELEIGSPAPPLVIVVQNLPKGARVVDSSPELKKYDPDDGVVKWLLAKVKSGKMLVSLRLDRPVALGELQGEIRSRSEAGEMVSIAIVN